MFGHLKPKHVVATTAGDIQIDGPPMVGGEGAGYRAKRGTATVFFKQFRDTALGRLSSDEVNRRRRARAEWLARSRLDLLDARLNAPFAASQKSQPPGYVCAWVEGMTLLSSWREQEHSYADRVNVVLQLSHLLSLVHDKKIAQGDLNADNVGVVGADSSLRVYLLDFGNYNNGDPALAPLMAGEEEHMANWIRKGALPSIESDVYALGVIAYEMLLARSIDAGESSRDAMMKRRESGVLPGDPLLGTSRGADIGLSFDILPPSIQSDLRNMLAPTPGVAPSAKAFLTHLRVEAPNLLCCMQCKSPYWWTPQRVCCPNCNKASPAAVALRLPSGEIQALRHNLILGRQQLGNADYLSTQHLALQPSRLGAATAFVVGKNGITLIRSKGERLHCPQGSGPIDLRPGDRLTLSNTSIEILR